MPKDLTAWLSLTVIGTIIATLGSLLGILIKDYWLARSFEGWKDRNAAKAAHRSLCKPLHVAGRQLVIRLAEIYDRYPPNYLDSSLLHEPESHFQTNNISDPHYRRYKLLSTAYRLSGFLGWLELYQRNVLCIEIAGEQIKGIDIAIHGIRTALADGQINTRADYETWKDRLIFRDEQRAIGDAVIAGSTPPYSIMGYGSFMESFDDGKQRQWLSIVLNFLLDHGSKDFRKDRIRLMIQHLFDLLLAIDPKLPEELAETRATHT